MQENIMNAIYQDTRLLEYLRYHPEWYKILYYNPNNLNAFLDEAKGHYKIRMTDKIEEFKNQLSFITSIIEYVNK